MSTIKEWYQIIIAEKESLSSLDVYTPNPETTEGFINDLKVQSSVAIWRLSAWIWAFTAFILEGKWSSMATILQKIQDETPPHTRRWWVDTILAYQEGDSTIVDDNGKVTYQTIDEEKQIVKLASVENVEGVWNATEADATANSVIIYPAKVTGITAFNTNQYAKLTGAEADALRQYVNDVKPLGIKTEVKENNIATINFLGYPYYDPKILTNGGWSIEDPDKNPFWEALYKFLDEDVNVKGVINRNRFEAAMLSVEGVSDWEWSRDGSGIAAFSWSPTSNGVYTNLGRNTAIDGVAIQYTTGTPAVELEWRTEDRI